MHNLSSTLENVKCCENAIDFALNSQSAESRKTGGTA